jgi:hypothetical protein
MKWSLWQSSAKAFVKSRSAQQAHKKICFFIFFTPSGRFVNPLQQRSLAFKSPLYNSLTNSQGLSSNQVLLLRTLLRYYWIRLPEVFLSESFSRTGFQETNFIIVF